MDEQLANSNRSALENIARLPFVRLCVVGLLVLCLQIPVLFIYNLASEREQTRQEAVQDVTSKWGLG